MYEIYASINNAKIRYSNVNDYAFIVDDIINKVTNKTKIIFIAQPNNPTGIYLDRKNLNKLLKRIPKRIIDTDILADASEDFLKSLVGKIPVGRLGTVEDVSRIVTFLASDDAGFITGSTITANGGQYFT